MLSPDILFHFPQNWCFPLNFHRCIHWHLNTSCIPEHFLLSTVTGLWGEQARVQGSLLQLYSQQKEFREKLKGKNFAFSVCVWQKTVWYQQSTARRKLFKANKAENKKEDSGTNYCDSLGVFQGGWSNENSHTPSGRTWWECNDLRNVALTCHRSSTGPSATPNRPHPQRALWVPLCSSMELEKHYSYDKVSVGKNCHFPLESHI